MPKLVGIKDWECLYLEDLLAGSIAKQEGISYADICLVTVEDGDKTALYARLKDGTMVKLLYAVTMENYTP